MPDPTKNAIKNGSTWYPFISLAGEVQSLAQVAEEITRPGVLGTAIRQLGQQGRKFEMIGVVDCDTQAAAITLAVALEALQGTICGPLLDAYGGTSDLVIVWEVQRISIRPCITATGGLSTLKAALLTMRFVLQRPTAPA